MLRPLKLHGRNSVQADHLFTALLYFNELILVN